MGQIKKAILLLMAVAAVAVSCRKTDNHGLEGEPNQAKVNITLNVEDVENLESRQGSLEFIAGQDGGDTLGVVTSCVVGGKWGDLSDGQSSRSTSSTIYDTRINDLWALQFNTRGELVGKPVYRNNLSGVTTISMMLTQTAQGESHTVCFVANTGKNDLFTIDNVPTREQLMALMHSFATEASVVEGSDLIMTGSYTGSLTAANSIPIAVPMERTVAKVTFTYRTANFKDGRFEVQAVQLKNVPKAGLYFLPGVVPGVYPQGGGDSHFDYAPESSVSSSSATKTWYVPENVRGRNTAIAWEGDKSKANAPAGQSEYATFMQIKGQATLKDGSSKNMLYVFYLGSDITDYSLRRNTFYNITIDFMGVDLNDNRVLVDISTPVLSSNARIESNSITGTSAVAGATILSDGGSAVTDKGFYISTARDFDVSDPGVIVAPAALTRGRGLDYEALSPALQRGMAVGSFGGAAGAGCAAQLPVLPSAASCSDSEPQQRASGYQTFNVTFSGLSHKTTYYARAYATNAYGTTVSDQQLEFATSGVPTVGELTITDITDISANGSFSLIDPGVSAVTKYGVVYSRSSGFNPANGTHVELDVPMAMPVAITGLENYQGYYLRAFAANAEGRGYGPQVSFWTKEGPSFKLDYVQDLKGTSVRVKASIWGGRGNTVIDRGIIWSTSPITDPDACNVGTPSDGSEWYEGSFGSAYPGDTWYMQLYVVLSYGATRYSSTYSSSSRPEIPPISDIVFTREYKRYIGANSKRSYPRTSIIGAKMSGWDPLDDLEGYMGWPLETGDTELQYRPDEDPFYFRVKAISDFSTGGQYRYYGDEMNFADVLPTPGKLTFFYTANEGQYFLSPYLYTSGTAPSPGYQASPIVKRGYYNHDESYGEVWFPTDNGSTGAFSNHKGKYTLSHRATGMVQYYAEDALGNKIWGPRQHVKNIVPEIGKPTDVSRVQGGVTVTLPGATAGSGGAVVVKGVVLFKGDWPTVDSDSPRIIAPGNPGDPVTFIVTDDQLLFSEWKVAGYATDVSGNTYAGGFTFTPNAKSAQQ